MLSAGAQPHWNHCSVPTGCWSIFGELGQLKSMCRFPCAHRGLAVTSKHMAHSSFFTSFCRKAAQWSWFGNHSQQWLTWTPLSQRPRLFQSHCCKLHRFLSRRSKLLTWNAPPSFIPTVLFCYVKQWLNKQPSSAVCKGRTVPVRRGEPRVCSLQGYACS